MPSQLVNRRNVLKGVGGVVGLLGAGGATTAIAQSDEGGSDDDTTADNGSGDIATVRFDSQTVSAGEDEVEVVVGRAVLPDGGWVVVHNELLLTDNDPVGSIIGVSEYLEPGEARYIEVEVPRKEIIDANEDGSHTLIAMAHREDGDSANDPTFEFPNGDDDEATDDGPYVDEEDTNGDGTDVVIDKARITFVYEDGDDEYGDDEYGDDEYGEDDEYDDKDGDDDDEEDGEDDDKGYDGDY